MTLKDLIYTPLFQGAYIGFIPSSLFGIFFKVGNDLFEWGFKTTTVILTYIFVLFVATVFFRKLVKKKKLFLNFAKYVPMESPFERDGPTSLNGIRGAGTPDNLNLYDLWRR